MVRTVLIISCCLVALTLAAQACEDKIREGPKPIKGGKVLNIAKCGKPYMVKDVTDAAAVCARHNGYVATLAQLTEARANGFSVCSCAWLADGTSAYSMVGSGPEPIPNCGGEYKINFCGADKIGKWAGIGWNANCFIPDSASCRNEVVGVSKSGNFIELARCGNDYNLASIAEAEELCAKYDAKLATTAQLKEQFDAGYGRCSCGWLAGGDAGYSRTKDTPKPGCGSIIGINICPADKMGKWGGDGWNANCYTTCLDTFRGNPVPIKGGKVVNIAKCGKPYMVKDLTDAWAVCARHNGYVATLAQLTEARANGFSVCSCAWLADGTSGYSMVGSGPEPIPHCGGEYKINFCGADKIGKWAGIGWNANCFIPSAA